MDTTWLYRIGVIVAGAACMAPGCNDDVLHDSAFRLWCGDHEDKLCDWTVDKGSVAKAPTWNEHEFGVELVDVGTQISQLSSEGSDCMEFSAVADVGAAAQVRVGIDFNLDGKEDYTSQIGETHWHVTRTLIYAPLGYGQHLRFLVHKEAEGRAVLAELRLQRATGCNGARAPIAGLLIGDFCTQDAECSSQICCGRRDLTQDGGVVTIPGTCSACCDGHPCPGGGTCAARANTLVSLWSPPPRQCDPGLRRGTQGAPCFADDDCASGCDGAEFIKDPTCGACGTVAVHAGQCR
jgi:hypothetical protein